MRSRGPDCSPAGKSISMPEDTTVHDAARYLREREVRAVGVCDQNGVLQGVVSQSDVSDKVAAENKCPRGCESAKS